MSWRHIERHCWSKLVELVAAGWRELEEEVWLFVNELAVQIVVVAGTAVVGIQNSVPEAAF